MYKTYYSSLSSLKNILFICWSLKIYFKSLSFLFISMFRFDILFLLKSNKKQPEKI